MLLPNPKDLRAVLKVCRDFGVETVEVGEIKIKFGEMPSASPPKDQADVIALGGPSEEDLMYWSAQPDPKAAMLDRLG